MKICTVKKLHTTFAQLLIKICTVVDKVIENRFLLKRKPTFMLKHDFLPGFDLVSPKRQRHCQPFLLMKHQARKKMFRLFGKKYFFLGEKLCLKFCTVINKVIENRFLLFYFILFFILF